jgi:hypothetical protein
MESNQENNEKSRDILAQKNHALVYKNHGLVEWKKQFQQGNLINYIYWSGKFCSRDIVAIAKFKGALRHFSTKND